MSYTGHLPDYDTWKRSPESGRELTPRQASRIERRMLEIIRNDPSMNYREAERKAQLQLCEEDADEAREGFGLR